MLKPRGKTAAPVVGRWVTTVYRTGTTTEPAQHGVATDLEEYLRVVTAPLPPEMTAVVDKVQLPAWGPYELLPGTMRNDGNVVEVTALVLDYDTGEDPRPALKSAGWAFGWYHSWSHTAASPRLRVVLPLAAPVPASLWKSFWVRETPNMPGSPDGACKDVSRQYFAFARRSDAHDSGYVLGKLYPVDLDGLEPYVSAAGDAGDAPEPEPLDPDVETWLSTLVAGTSVTQIELDAIAAGKPYGGPGQWQAANQRLIPFIANAWLSYCGIPPTAEELWAIFSRCVPEHHVDDTWRFCHTVAQSRLIDNGDPDASAPYGGGVRDPALYAKVRLQRGKKFIVPSEVETMRVILSEDPRWIGRISLDTLTTIPAIDEHPVEDNDLVAVANWLFRVYRIEKIAKTAIYDAMMSVAHDNPVDPVVKWIEALPPWDGKSRLGTWLIDLAGANGDPDLLSHYGRGFFVGLVARQFEPSAQADNVLTLWGEQGIRKSSLLRAVVPFRDWFSDSQIDLSDNKRLLASLGGKVLIEWGELAAVSRSDVETTKAFLTSQVDRFVPMYGRMEVTRPRRVVFAATLNKNNRIPEAGRRWWVVDVARRCDVDGMKRERDQLWAEGLYRYRAGEQWHLTPDLDERQADDVVRYAAIDDWLECVRDYSRRALRNTELSLKDLALRILSIDGLRGREGERLDRALQQCGWQRSGYHYVLPLDAKIE